MRTRQLIDFKNIYIRKNRRIFLLVYYTNLVQLQYFNIIIKPMFKKTINIIFCIQIFLL